MEFKKKSNKNNFKNTIGGILERDQATKRKSILGKKNRMKNIGKEIFYMLELQSNLLDHLVKFCLSLIESDKKKVSPIATEGGVIFLFKISAN